jgi:hypothetical protein
MGGVRGCTLRVAARRQIVSAGSDFGRFGNLPAKKAVSQSELRAHEKPEPTSRAAGTPAARTGSCGAHGSCSTHAPALLARGPHAGGRTQVYGLTRVALAKRMNESM